MPEPKPHPAPIIAHSPAPTLKRRRQNSSISPSPSPTHSTYSPTRSISLPMPFLLHPPHQQSQSASPLSSPSSTSSSRQRGKPCSSRTLSTILEASPMHSPVSTRTPTLSKTSSLRRRRKKQLLRTPSIELAFPSRALTFSSSTVTVDLYSSGTSTHYLFSVDTPPTTLDGLDSSEEDPATSLRLKGGEYGDASGDDLDLYERPDSRSSYCTARSEFSDAEPEDD
ncbi:hypothetical protein DXG03_009240 [Asterophora parasitica]|uniref:Uncharacterized protein n=1 Tax=Asterophora parasitica TaxID=117018 RepID=A0A9P7KCM4_9AGAR|nr:hypothetical protein DXG03_009240 [Asterophora parasitica]